MHLVVKSHLKSFTDNYPTSNSQDVAFEAFVNFCILRQFSGDNVDPHTLVFNGDDPGIDGVMIFVNDTFIATREEFELTMNGATRDVEVSVVFSQSKTSEKWEKAQINNFAVGVMDFISDDPSFPMGEELIEQREIFFDLFSHIGKIKSGKPNIYCYYATTDRFPDATEIMAAFVALKEQLSNKGYFDAIITEPISRDEVIQMWLAAGGATEAQIETIGIAPFPKVTGVAASYVATVHVKSYIEKILTDDSGKLRQRIFDENVRDYIGSDADVNKEIADTIVDKQKQNRFGVMNNGVTIVSPDVRVQGNEIFLKDFQVINGCQTSNVLFENKHEIDGSASLMVKIVHASDPTFIEDVVRATNRQSKVQDDQFLATIDAIKGIEKYFEARGEGEDHRLYFERRRNQYGGRNVPAIRIFDVKNLARCVGAMFLSRPDLAARYPNRLTGELKNSVFDPLYDEEIFYTAALAYYRIFLNFSNNRIDQKYSSLKWHLMHGLRVYLDDGVGSNLKSRKIRKLCTRVQDLVTSTDQADMKILSDICYAISGGDRIPRDQLRAQSLTSHVVDSVTSLRRKS